MRPGRAQYGAVDIRIRTQLPDQLHGECEALVDAEQVAAVLRFVLDDEDDVVEPLDHLVGQSVELLDDERLEGFGGHVHAAVGRGLRVGIE